MVGQAQRSLVSNTVVADGNEIGVISFQDADGSDVESEESASIFVAVDGTPGGDDTPGRMMFATCVMVQMVLRE